MKPSKTINNILIKYFILLFALMVAGVMHAQDNQETEIKNLLESKRFVFKAQTASPQRGGTRNLTSDYDLKIMEDSLVSYLPYFGRAYTAPIGNSQGGLQFTSTNFSYEMEQKKKDWEITLLPKDGGDVRQMYLTVFSNGSASLRVLSNNRETISFNGRIEKIKQ